MLTHTLGFPRMGADRELKKAVEGYWKGEIHATDLQARAAALRLRHWKLQTDNGIGLVPVGDFSLYDHILDMCVTLGVIPQRYGSSTQPVQEDTYFAMARGRGGSSPVTALEMTKWFDTNYHYLVPEFTPDQTFSLSADRLVQQVREAREAGFTPKAVVTGPFTFLGLGKSTIAGCDRWKHLDALVTVYEELLATLARECSWIQIDEPILVTDSASPVLDRLGDVYDTLEKAASPAKIMLATYFGDPGESLEAIFALPVAAVHLDLVRAPALLDQALERIPASMSLSLGLVNGRNVWRADLDNCLNIIARAEAVLPRERLLLAPSCSLLHAPLDLDLETKLNPEVMSWLAFAKQKCQELALLAQAAQGGDITAELAANRTTLAARRTSPLVVNSHVQQRLSEQDQAMTVRDSPYPQRAKTQRNHLSLPLLPTTTIGSFPQTTDIRSSRKYYKTGKLSKEGYKAVMRSHIADTVKRQEDIGLDVLVHGEAERNDMVEYFGEQLEGFAFTSHGWVQSYGSRCVKPPIIYGDVWRPHPMTVSWITYAQSRTSRPMKGMLTGPVTMLCWSFVRDDQPRETTCRQIALAIRDEVLDLEKAGISIIQIDEPALRERLPLRRAAWNAYLESMVEAFRLATCGVKDATQIHTHMCYCEFDDILTWIAAMDADVISIEASRSNMTLLTSFENQAYPQEVGPGVYDIHSPRIPSEQEMVALLHKALQVIPQERLWVNPDCGLKTRNWNEAAPSLTNMVQAAKTVRDQLNKTTS
ncbi:MAG: 5-methyltetrahydropteroyltriglutamate--homocysteine S-methyltransferase [Deltaproteobacteria bacterium]|nr:MAG: 5-methyltetrahydropteroyltriglutamate--homocysteine S-methyltransferase [Deltaproteobacteria bacterium]